MKKEVINNPYPGVLQIVKITFDNEKEEAEFYKPYTDAVRKATEKYKREEREAIAKRRKERGLPPLIY